MFSKLALFAIAIFAAFVAALPSPGGAEHAGDVQSCSSGPVQCCNSVQQADSSAAQSLLGLLGLLSIVGDLTASIGISCSPLLGGSTSCSSQTVCCQNNNFNGLINIGCTPINIGL